MATLPVFLPILTSVIRLIAPFFIFFCPVPATIANVLLDMLDGIIFDHAGISRISYDQVDKFLDLYWYGFIMIYLIINRNDIPFFYIFLFLFCWRILGGLLYYFIHSRSFFFFFPNAFEPLFWLYLLSVGTGWFDMSKGLVMGICITLVLAIKLPLEYLMHIKNADITNALSQVFLGRNVMRWK